jgi:hypothetical protein
MVGGSPAPLLGARFFCEEPSELRAQVEAVEGEKPDLKMLS